MQLKFYYIRFIRYYKKNGLLVTLKRIREKLVQSIFQRDEFVFYLDLILLNKPEERTPDNFKIEAKTKIEDINRKLMDSLNNHIGVEILPYQLSKRFAQSAIFWIIKVDDNLAGYVWSIGKSTYKCPCPYYFPLCDNDVFLFDGSVLPQYRGRNLYPLLLKHVLYGVKKLGFIRAICDAHEWNVSVIKSFSKAGLKKLGTVRKYSLMGHEFVLWKS